MRKTALRTFQITVASLLASWLGGCHVTALTDGLPKGTTPPELQIEDWLNTEGEQALRIDELRGRPVLVEFWSKECPPCVKNLPRIKRIQKDYASMGLQVVTVHVSLEKGDARQDAGAVRAFATREDLTYPIGVDQSGRCWKEFDFGYLPHAVLLDERGRVIWSGNLYVHNIEKVVRRRFGTAPVASPVAAKKMEFETIEGVGAGGCEGGVCRPS